MGIVGTMAPNPDDTGTAHGIVDQTVPETPEALKDMNSPGITTPVLQTPTLPEGTDLYHSSPMVSKVSNLFANSNIIGGVEECLLIDFGDTPLVDPTTVTAQPILRHANKLDLLFDDLEILQLSPCPVTLPTSPGASSTTMYPDDRKSSTVDLLTPTPNLTLYSSFTPSIKPTATTEAVEYRPRTRAERAAEPHTATRPNWALAPAQRPVFTKEPGPRHSISDPSLPKYPLPPSQPLLGLNLVNYGAPSINENDCSPAPLEKPIATSPPHDATEPPLCKPPAPSVHPSRLRLLRSSGAPSEAGFGHAETKTQTAAGSLNEEITGANTVPVAKMRKWGAGATEGACTETSASGNIDEKGAMRSKVPWVDKDPPPHSAATIDTVPIGSKTVASARIPVQAATRPTPTKRQPCPVIIEPESGDDADRPTPSPSSQLSHIDNNLSVPAPSAPSLVLPSALRQRNVAEHPYEPPNPFMDQEPTQESVSIDKPRLPLLQRMGIGARVGPSALAARQKLFIEEGGRMYDDAYQCANEEAYEEYDEEEYRTPPWARTKKVVIAEPVGREERVELTPPIRTPAKRVVRIAELGPPSRVQTRRRRVIRYQEGDQGEVGECEVTYDQYLQEDPHIGTAAGRRIPVSQTEHNPPPRASAAIQQDSPRHIVGSRARRVVIQAPLEADSVDKVVERFRGLSVAGRVQTPGPRRHKVMKVHAQRLETPPPDQYFRR